MTLTGPGGTGKTRLALQAAAEAAERLPGGIWFVGLAAISDAAGIAPAVALALGVTEETLAGTLATAQALIVLDNLEQIDEVGTVVADLLANAPEVVLVGDEPGPPRPARRAGIPGPDTRPRRGGRAVHGARPTPTPSFRAGRCL